MKHILVLMWIMITIILPIQSQDISVMHFSGDSFTFSDADEKVTYKKIVFGPIPAADKILVKDNASLKLLNGDDETCEINKAGTYTIKDLVFSESKSNSVFSKFCDYFHSFFVNHSSAESKANYKNSIHAISRGIQSPPLLDFPLSGSMPVVSGSIPFSWSHACDSCQYVVSINDMETRANVYAWTTKEHQVVLENPDQFLLPNHKYYWTVTVSGQEMDNPTHIFTMSDRNDFMTRINKMNGELNAAQLDLDEATKTIYMMSQLDDLDLANYALYYGMQQSQKYPDNALLNNYVERFWYDGLME